MAGSSAQTATAGSGVHITQGPPAIDPVLRMYLETRWRAGWAELRQIALIMGWEDRLPTRPN